MTEQAEPAEAPDDIEVLDSDETQPVERSTRGKRRRRKLVDLLNDAPRTSGQNHLMYSDGVAPRHRLVFRGDGITSQGGPADLILELARELAASVKGIMPTANPQIGSLVAGNSMTLYLYPPADEISAAEARSEDLDDDSPTVERLPDTTLAVVTLGMILSEADAGEAARITRRLGTVTTNEVRRLAVSLADDKVELDIADVEPGAQVTPEWALSLVEHLDASEEVPAVVVAVVGVLQGANSRGDGEFEIVTDEDKPLDPALGPRRSPGSTIRGGLSPQARQQIREAGLWDRHVSAKVQVVRRRQGRSIRVESMRLVSVAPRFARGESPNDDPPATTSD